MVSKPFFFSKLMVMTAVASVVFAGTPAIGIITASGHFTLDRSQVWGNSTLFDGAVVETELASSELALRNGVRMQLGAASRARVWENRTLLERGVGQMAGPTSYEVDAGGLKIRADSANARVRVSLSRADHVEVTALSGSARVASGSGLLLAAIPAGRSMIFSMQAAATGVITRTGCLLFKDGHFILQDDNTQEVVELTGMDLSANTGNRVEITGTPTGAKPAVTIATSQMNVTSDTLRSQGGCLTVATALSASTEAPATGITPATSATVPSVPAEAGGGMSTGAKIGIGAAAAGGGGAAIILLTQKKSSTSP